MVVVKNAIVSVSDKSHLSELVRYFEYFKINVYATGGTYKELNKYENKINLVNLSDYTKFPEIMDGRIKTLHPSIYSGILARKNKKQHMQELTKFGFQLFDLVVVNLYPFEDFIREKKNSIKPIENIDIGGPCMIRSAAKNFERVIVLSSPKQYEDFLKISFDKSNKFDLNYRKKVAIEAFKLTSNYDGIITSWLENNVNIKSISSIPIKKISDLKYGENPHQKAALYSLGRNPYERLNGKDLSYNNILDLNVASNLVYEFKETACVVVKHSNPCGVAIRGSQINAFKIARNTDSVSSFGGIVAFNKKLDLQTCRSITKYFLEAVIAPDFDKEGLKFLKKKKNLIIIKYKKKVSELDFDVRTTRNFFLVQEFNKINIKKQNIHCITQKKPSPKSLKDLLFAFTVVKYVSSNAIVIASNFSTIGIGVGETSRIEAARQAISKISQPSKSSVLASDGFFPFPDIVSLCKKNNIVSIIQPGGSKNDKTVVSKANEDGISMIITGLRHFKH